MEPQKELTRVPETELGKAAYAALNELFSQKKKNKKLERVLLEYNTGFTSEPMMISHARSLKLIPSDD